MTAASKLSFVVNIFASLQFSSSFETSGEERSEENELNVDGEEEIELVISGEHPCIGDVIMLQLKLIYQIFVCSFYNFF